MHLSIVCPTPTPPRKVSQRWVIAKKKKDSHVRQRTHFVSHKSDRGVRHFTTKVGHLNDTGCVMVSHKATVVIALGLVLVHVCIVIPAAMFVY